MLLNLFLYIIPKCAWFNYLLTEEESTKDVVKKAAQSVGSLSDTEFVIAFNPDVFQPHVRHVDPEVRGLDHFCIKLIVNNQITIDMSD